MFHAIPQNIVDNFLNIKMYKNELFIENCLLFNVVCHEYCGARRIGVLQSCRHINIYFQGTSSLTRSWSYELWFIKPSDVKLMNGLIMIAYCKAYQTESSIVQVRKWRKVTEHNITFT